MSERGGRLDKFQIEFLQRQSLKKRRSRRQRMNRRADVVDETGQRQFRRTRSAADGFICLDD
ncbi:MAG TPA: hypothetical protein VF721_21825 [Pyrinomonadaceae bacterium]|jgi:sulfur relay (sulfurtransferase) DsrF/TusC family protein